MKVLKVLVLSLAVFLQACAEPGDTTSMGAATGGVLGAGLGALVGNQTGNPGTGVVVGALAGSGTGAAIGNTLEAQEQAIHSQDQAIERQERQIQAQNAEIQELRRSTQDSISFRNNPAPIGNGIRQLPSNARASFKEESLPILQDSQASAPAPLVSAECADADKEALQANSQREAADKLFHLRRALRLCPSNGTFHTKIAQVYLGMGRKVDAEFEFKEALRINPADDYASNQLRTLDLGARTR